MNSNQISLIKSTWGEVISSGDSVGESFYTILFDKDPGLKKYFTTDPIEQARKFTSMITFFAFKLDNLDYVLSEARELGKRHKFYKTPDSAYKTVKKALIAALAENLRDKWDDETEQAWNQLYLTLQGAMLEGALV
ncbi:globin domain-containing protein [Sporocytophaga myxococcoides]|uniref:globin domain-containing protein n=1 Tax=Sporocytophaga myxococcoides TaxID=153721 RepID=UPI00041E8644|nr:globin domain-containing protein [Sporocytophaga myxococcoides]